MVEASATDILRMRQWAHRLDPASPRDTDPVATVRHLLATQAQDFEQGLWSIGSRTPTAARSSVIDALNAGTVVRSMPMRGTLHFIAAEDLGWMLQLTASRTLQSSAARRKRLELDDDTLTRAADITIGALRGGVALNRAAYMALFESNGISTVAGRGYHIIFHLSQLGLVCWGPSDGKQQSLVLVDEWIAHPRRFTDVEAMRELVLRYFGSHGPATIRDLAWWSKLPLTGLRAALATTDLIRIESGGETYFSATDTLSSPDLVHALAGFDEYLIAYENRALFLRDDYFDRVVKVNGIFLPFILADGRVVGGWAKPPKGHRTSELFEPISGTQTAALERAFEAHASFLAG
jgi:hypothetical protein